MLPFGKVCKLKIDYVMIISVKLSSWKTIPAVLFTFFLMIYIVFELFGVLTLSDIQHLLQSAEPFVEIIIIGLLALDLIIPVPSSVIMTFSGSMYGFLAGAILGTIGSLTGSIIGFFVFRTKGQKITRFFLNEKEEEIMNESFNNWGEGIIILSRMIPLLTETMSCFAGLTKISFKRFLLFITIGTVPVALYYSYFGSRLKTVSDWPIPLAIGIIIPGIIWIILGYKSKK